MGIREAIIPIRSLFMYPGYRRVVVLAAIIVDTYRECQECQISN